MIDEPLSVNSRPPSVEFRYVNVLASWLMAIAVLLFVLSCAGSQFWYLGTDPAVLTEGEARSIQAALLISSSISCGVLGAVGVALRIAMRAADDLYVIARRAAEPRTATR